MLTPSLIFRQPLKMLVRLSGKSNLIRELLKREVAVKYRGSLMGRFWLVLQPLILLCLYTFVFSFVLKARWGVGLGEAGRHENYAILLFSSLLVFNIFAETVSRSPGLITSNPNYVKKIVFPTEILGVVLVASSLIQYMVGLLLLLVAYSVLVGWPPSSVLYLPLLVGPLLLLCLGLSWLLSSLGVFFRDLVNLAPSVVTTLMFITPVFYPSEAVPEQFRFLHLFNPLAFFVENSRQLLVPGYSFPWSVWLAYVGVSLVISWLGLAVYLKLQPTFSDVI